MCPHSRRSALFSRCSRLSAARHRVSRALIPRTRSPCEKRESALQLCLLTLELLKLPLAIIAHEFAAPRAWRASVKRAPRNNCFSCSRSRMEPRTTTPPPCRLSRLGSRGHPGGCRRPHRADQADERGDGVEIADLTRRRVRPSAARLALGRARPRALSRSMSARRCWQRRDTCRPWQCGSSDSETAAGRSSR
jgi:hypothetical protein